MRKNRYRDEAKYDGLEAIIYCLIVIALLATGIHLFTGAHRVKGQLDCSLCHNADKQMIEVVKDNIKRNGRKHLK